MPTKGLKMIITAILASALIIGLLVYWQSSRNTTPSLVEDAEESINGPFTPEEQKVNNPNPNNTMNPIAIFKTNKGEVQLELFADQMPITTENFIKLSESGFYNNTKFHRVIDGFMIQGGDPNSKGNDESVYGTGGPDYTIQDEFVKGDLLTNTRGTISMANTGQPNSGGSQFFINLVDNTGLDFDKEPLSSRHPVFGRVIKGMDIVDAIGKAETKAGDIPADPIIIESVTIQKS